MALETLSQAQKRLAEAGFVADLTVSGRVLHDSATGREYEPAALKVIELVRFEGTSDPGDEAILLAIATRDGAPVGTFTAPFSPTSSADEAEIVRHLHRVIATEEETAEHGSHDHVAAIMPSREAAEVAIEELREVGLGSEHLGVALRHGDHAVFERDEEADLAHDVEEGMLAGAGLGFLAGMALFAVAVPGIGTIGAGGIAALGAASGFGGTMLGGYFGVAVASDEFDSHERLRETTLEPDEVLVVACGHHHPDLVEAAMERNGGRLIATAS
jgi:hypothetical protein